MQICAADGEGIARAVAALRAGGVVGMPTETVYGLAADAENEAAVARLFSIKGRPTWHPLIVHIGSADLLRSWAASVPAAAYRLAEEFWPGPLTLVLPRGERVPLAVTGGNETVALRVPSHPVALELLKQFGGGVAAPSANRFGSVSPTTAAEVAEELGDAVDLILDGGACSVGVESTVVDLTGDEPAILRPGGVPREQLERVLERTVPLRQGGKVRSPGQLASHYAPRAEVVLVAESELVSEVRRQTEAGRRVGVLVAGAPAEPLPEPAIVRHVPAGLDDYARCLYRLFRTMDRDGCDVVVTTLPEAAGLGLAIGDRLTRAAAGRGAGTGDGRSQSG